MADILENRIIDFSTLILDISDNIKNNYKGEVLKKQLIRSGISITLNHGESQSSESRKDFIHKSSIKLKELRETFMNLKLLKNAKLIKVDALFEKAFIENNELIAIHVASIKTAKRNASKDTF